MKINKVKLNLLLDILMFIHMLPIIGIGFLIKSVLVPGYERNSIYGHDVELYFCGIDRHQWGTIHFLFSLVLIFLLGLHIVFHWKQVVCIFNKMLPLRLVRVVIALVLLMLTIVIGILPLIVTPQIKENVSHNAHANELPGVSHTYEPKQIKKQFHNIESTKDGSAGNTHGGHAKIEIYGYMTLNELAKKYKVNAKALALSINVPQGNMDERLGRLRRKYGFELSDLKRYLENKLTENIANEEDVK